MFLAQAISHYKPHKRTQVHTCVSECPTSWGFLANCIDMMATNLSLDRLRSQCRWMMLQLVHVAIKSNGCGPT
jgi:hypothetical protein